MKLILKIHSLLTLSVGVTHLIDAGRNRSCKAWCIEGQQNEGTCDEKTNQIGRGCIFAHIDLDASMMEDKLIALIDSCDLDLPYLPQNFANIVLYFSLISSVEQHQNVNLTTAIAQK
jgi:hypothetical protein